MEPALDRLISTQVAITIDDDDVEAATSKAREAERRKRERLARDDGEGWLATAPKQAADAELREVELACDDLDVPTIQLTDDVAFPRYLGHALKQHQVEACKFIYAQTIESLRALENRVRRTTRRSVVSLRTVWVSGRA